MLESLKTTFSRSKAALLIGSYFLIVSIWWIWLYSRNIHEGNEAFAFSLIYPMMSLIGGLLGFKVAKNWGGLKSNLGRSITFFSLGLLFQYVGQIVYTYFIFVRLIDIPYPSLGDIGYFGSVIFYLIGAFWLTRTTFSKFTLAKNADKVQAIITPLIILSACIFLFLRQYSFDWTEPIKTFLDFGYPVFEALYISVALWAHLLSRSFLGGIIRAPILFLVFALGAQYFSDFTFLLQASMGTWQILGPNEYLYFISYTAMALALLQLEVVRQRFKEAK